MKTLIPAELNTSIKLANANVWLNDKGIIEVAYHQSIGVLYKDIQEVFNARMQFYEGRKQAVLVDMSKVQVIAKDAQEFISSRPVSIVTKAMAFYCTRPVSDLVCEFYHELEEPDFPVKLFLDKEKAMNWLMLFSKLGVATA